MRKITGLATLLLVLVGAPAKATPLLDITDATGIVSCVPSTCTLGYDFTASGSFVIDALGVWDAGANGLASPHDVGLWTIGGALLASTTVTNGNSTPSPSVSGDGRWLFTAIAPMVLGPGSYVLGFTWTPGTDLTVSGAGVLTLPGFTYGSERAAFGASLTFPTAFPDATANGWFGANLSAQSVPEPASLTLIGLGLAGAAIRLRRSKP